MKKSAAMLLILILISSDLYSQDRWTKLNGPEGGRIQALIAKGDSIIAGTGGISGITGDHGTIFYSTNKGMNWLKAGFRNNGRVADFDFTNDGGVIAAAYTSGIIKSFDLQNWFNLHQGGTNYEFWSVGVGEGSNIYAGSQPGYFLGSTNNGNNWYQIAYLNGGVDDLLYLNGYVYLTHNEYIMRKQEPYGQWDTVFTFLFDNKFSLASNASNLIFAPSWNNFHISFDFGTSWEQRDTLHFLYHNHLYACIFNNRLIGACSDDTYLFGNLWGVIVSDDLGYTWRMSNNGLPPKISAVKLASSGNETYVGTSADGVYRSTDYGDSWTAINNGLHAAEVIGIAFDPAGNLYSAAYGSGISKSTDKGLSWTKISNGFDQLYVYDVQPYDNNLIFAGTDYGLFKSTNGGENWSKLPSVGGDFINKLHKDKFNRLYATDYYSGIYRSSDAGITWIRINNDFNRTVMSMAFDSSGGIYAGTRGGYIYKTTNDGQSWALKYSYSAQNPTINGLCVTPNGTVFATAYRQGIIRSTDQGQSWSIVKANTGYYGKWPVESNSQGDVYTTTLNDILFLSTDNGNTWQNVTSNGVMLRVKDILFDDEDYAYLATDESVWRSTAPTPVELISFTAEVNLRNVTLNWETATETNNRGFEIERKTSSSWITIAFIEGKGTTTDKQAYSFTDKNLEKGRYKFRLKQIDFDGTFEYSDEVEADVSSPKEFALNQNYPNPFNPSTTISFSLPKPEYVVLKIYNILGEEIRTAVNRELTAGDHQISFNATELSSGIYFYRITAGEYTAIMKMQVLK